MAAGLSLPLVPSEHFSNPPLKLMLGQIRFPSILQLASRAHIAPFQDAIRDEYPEFAEEQKFSIEVSVDASTRTDEVRTFRFTSADSRWSVQLATDSVTLELSRPDGYLGFVEFRDRMESVWNYALQVIRPTRIVHQGLRYIDHFDWTDVQPEQWSAFIRPELAGLLAEPAIASRIQHTLTDTRIEIDDTTVFAFKYGLVRTGPNNVLGYLLDSDCYTANPSDMTLDGVLERFDAFHDEIHKVFRWAVTEAALNRFRSASGI